LKETLLLNGLDELPQIAAELLRRASNKRVFLFEAPMGTGKTTLIKALCKELGVDEHVTSPTFSIVNEYLSAAGPVYHFDFYRLKNEQEALDLGYEEYFYSGNYCFVEWPEKITSLLPNDAFVIEMETGTEDRRIIKIKSEINL